ncbi:DUF2628 domain-containing protein [Fibrella arboris]|uniref:DUF2628 domain-containing protein n=1 Tax=Fibrella arboris TaxID=3242486 RepID=UPI0035213ACB
MTDYLPYFFGPRADYYCQVVDDLEQGKVRFNEGAFFFGMFWMAYRKMYANAAITFALIMAESALEDWLIPVLSETYAYMLVSNLLIASLIGFSGNRLYSTFSRRQVARLTQRPILQDAASERDVLAVLRRQGGVSWVGPLVLLLAFIGLTTLIFYITM